MSDKNKKFEIVATTLKGLEEVLAKELEDLGATRIHIQRRAVTFEGDKEMLYRCNLCLRTALRILRPIHRFRLRKQEDLYKEALTIDWEEYLSVDKCFAINAVVNNSDVFDHSHYVALKLKDAIVDQFREKYNERPSIDTKLPDVHLQVHIRENRCTFLLNSSGHSLHRRGYRTETNAAPINEVLAAGLVLLSGWEKKGNFIDGMCGSGTILIEAGFYAYNIPPNIKRKYYGFMKWNDYDFDLWQKVREEALENRTEFEHEIFGRDVSPKNIRMSDKNVEQAGLKGKITLKRQAFESQKAPEGDVKGVLITNPPYDERMEEKNLDEVYAMMGNRLKQHFEGYDAWIISSNIGGLKNVGLKTSRKIALMNGSLECKFQKYELYKGSKRKENEEEVEAINDEDVQLKNREEFEIKNDTTTDTIEEKE